MNVVCAPKAVQVPGANLRYILYDYAPNNSVGSLAPSVIQSVRRFGLNPAPRAWDFLSIALSVIASDEGCPRNKSPDGWTREIDLTISVVDASFWETQSSSLNDALRFLTGDIWNLHFINGGALPAPRKDAQLRREDTICLLSGGMDSLIGAIDLKAAGKKLLLVSQVSKGDKARQRYFAEQIAGQNSHLQLNHLAHPPGTSERSQRARSFIFLGFGVLAATSLATYTPGASIDLYIPENGFIGLNVPLTPLRLGSLSTRTTHPYFIRLIQKILDAADIRVRLVNPYQYLTKGEMLVACKDQAFLQKHIGATTSCGRYARTAFKHCGRCVPCLIRRAAFQHWGSDPTPTYRYKDLSKKGPKHRDFDDVRSAAMAVETARSYGFNRWAGGSINAAQVGDAKPYRQVAERGLNELGAFLKSAGVL